jgi:hypothetical protein
MQQMKLAIAAADLARELADFMQVYADRPVRQNHGGMRFNHSFATWFILKFLQPRVVIESGVWRGHSTWLIERTCPNARIFCLDPNLSRLVYRSMTATYLQKDFAQYSWADIDPSEAVCFFDDHQNAYQRLKDLRWAGFTRAVFEDNFPCGEGDCYSLRHMLNGFGHEHIQMSKAYLRDWRARWRRRLLEYALLRVGPRQQLIVPANTMDRELFCRNCAEYFEFPPVVLNEMTHWGTRYEGHYQASEPIFNRADIPPDLRNWMIEDPTEFDYSFITFVALTKH